MKFEPRAKLGYLVAYDASNIWDIWLPTQKKVVRARDIVFQEESRYNPLQPLLTDFSKTTLPRMAVEVVPSFAVQDAWNELPTVDPGAVLTSYERVEAEGVPQGTNGRLINVENKVDGRGEQRFSTREQPLNPPFLPSPEATPTPAQNILTQRTTPGTFPDDGPDIYTSPTGPQVSVQVPIQARVNTSPTPAPPALDPPSPS
jgi:hypothetical protein